MPIGIPITCLYNFVPNRIKMLSNKRSAHHIHFDKTMHDIFLGISEVKKCKVRRVFSIDGSFNKTNTFIFNLIMRSSSVKSRKIVSGQTDHIETFSFKCIQFTPEFLIDQNVFLPKPYLNS